MLLTLFSSNGDPKRFGVYDRRDVACPEPGGESPSEKNLPLDEIRPLVFKIVIRKGKIRKNRS